MPPEELSDVAEDRFGRVYTSAPAQARPNVVPVATPEGDPEGRRPAGVRVDGVIRRGFPTPSGRLEFYSATLAEWGWPEYALPGYIRSHVHPAALGPGQMVLISTFRLPVQIHTRGGNAKWLNELAHTNPLWIHPGDARRLGIASGDLVRVETQIGHSVVKAWVTEGIRPGVVACSHHMGRWKLSGAHTPGASDAESRVPAGPRQVAATVDLTADRGHWEMWRRHGVAPYESADPDTHRIWWGDVGVHQNLTFPVQPDPISGQHRWHQAVRVRRARRRLRRHRRRHGQSPRGLPELAAPGTRRRRALTRRHPPPLLAAAPAETKQGRLPAQREARDPCALTQKCSAHSARCANHRTTSPRSSACTRH